MITQELIEFIKKSLAIGETKDSIVNKLKNQGWNEEDLIEAFNEISNVGESERIIETEQLPERKSNNKLIKVIIVLIVLLFLGGVYLYAFGYFVGSGKIFKNFNTSSQENKSFSYEVDVDIDLSSMIIDNNKGFQFFDLGEDKIMGLSLKGSIDSKDPNNLKSEGVFSFVANKKIFLSLSFKTIKQSVYVSFIKAPDIGFISLESIENKWIEIPIDNPDEFGDSLVNLPITMTDFNFADNLTDEEKDKLAEIFNNYNLIKINKRYLPQIIDKSLVYHLGFVLNKEEIKLFMTDMVAFLNNLKPTNISPNSSIEINNDNFDQFFESITDFKGEMWIGMFDGLPYRFKLNFNLYDFEDLEKGFSKVTLFVNYKNWNKTINIDIPENSISIQELFSNFFSESIFNQDIDAVDLDFIDISDE